MLHNQRVIGLLILVALLFTACQPIVAQPVVQLADEDVAAAVDAIWDEYEASLLAGDVDRWMNLWTEDGVKLSPGLLPIVGKDAIREYLAPRLDAFEYDMTITNEEIQVGGEWAVARGVYQATLTPKAGGDDIPVDGKYMTMLQRQPNGSWKIHRDIVNSNVPPAAAPETDVDEVAAAIDAIWREYEASLLAGDADRWIAQWMDDGVQMPPDMPPRVGKETIYASVSGFLSNYEYTDFVIENEDAEVNGDLAFARGTYAASFVAKAGGDPVRVEGKYMTILKRQPDGGWKLYRDIFNSNVPPAIPTTDSDVIDTLVSVWGECTTASSVGEEHTRVTQGVFATRAFQDAMRRLATEPGILAEAQRDPDEFFNRFGIEIPRDSEVKIVVEGDSGLTTKAAGRVICVSWCTPNACYTYCARLQH